MTRTLSPCLFVALIILAGRASGQEADPAEEKAREHFENGILLVEAENWEAAIVEFEASIELLPTAGAHFNRAMCLKALHRYNDALAAFEAFLEKYDPDPSDARRQEAEASIQEIESLLGSIFIEVNVDGAEILVDSKLVGKSPLDGPVPVSPGVHTIEVKADGFIPEEKDLKVASDQIREVEIYLSAIPQVGFLTVESSVDGAQVLIDEKPVGEAPYKSELSVGKHTVTVEKKYHKPYSTSVNLELGQNRFIDATLQSRRTVHKGWFWGMTGLAIASTLATVSLGISVAMLDRDYDEFTSSDADYKLGHRLMLAVDINLGMAVASAVTAFVLSFFTDFEGKGAAEVEALQRLELGPSSLQVSF